MPLQRHLGGCLQLCRLIGSSYGRAPIKLGLRKADVQAEQHEDRERSDGRGAARPCVRDGPVCTPPPAPFLLVPEKADTEYRERKTDGLRRPVRFRRRERNKFLSG